MLALLLSACSDDASDPSTDPDPNQAPNIEWQAPADGTTIVSGLPVVVRARVTDDYTAHSTLAVSITSDLDEILWEGAPAEDGTIAQTVDDLSNGRHTLILSAVDGDGLETSASAVLTVAGDGPVPTVTITPASPTSADDLVAEITASTDLDSYDITVTWNEAGGGTASGETLSAETTTRGQVWQVMVTVDSDETEPSRAVAQVTISNAPPSLETLALSPEAPTRSDTLTCGWSGWSDADGDPESVAVEWFRQGSDGPVRISGDEGTREAADLTPGDRVRCRVTPVDEYDAGVALQSDWVTIANEVPVVGAVEVASDTFRIGDPLWCVASEVGDGEDDEVFLTWTWSINGELVADATERALWSGFSAEDTVQCAAVPSDRFDTGSEVISDPVTILSTPPDVLAVELVGGSHCTPSTCRVTEYLDVDGDTPTTTYRWWVEGTELADTGQQIPAVRYGSGDEVQCAARATDGQTDDEGELVYGAEARSAAVIALDRPPNIRSVAAPDHGRVGDLLRCTVEVEDDCTAQESLEIRTLWTVNGDQVPGAHEETFSSLGLAAGDLVACVATVTDEVQSTQPVASPGLRLSATGWDLVGRNEGSLMGYSVAVLDDRNGDGFGELVLGEPSATIGDAARAGRAIVVYGRDDVERFDMDEMDGDAGFLIDGDNGAYDLETMACGPFVGGVCPIVTDPGVVPLDSYEAGPDGAALGFGLTSPGDIDNDGVGDLVVSAPYAQVGEIWRGTTYVISGAEAERGILGPVGGDAGYVFDGECGRRVRLDDGVDAIVARMGHDGDLAGFRAAGLGDFNGDGLHDFAVSAPHHGWSDEGTVYVVYGRTDGERVRATDLLVEGCEEEGDLTVGTAEGAAGIGIYGRRNNSPTPHRWGRLLAPAGDFNGDGYDDVVISDGGVSFYNHATVVLGGLERTSLQIQGADPERKYRVFLGDYDRGRIGLGFVVGGGGDMNGDGLDDIAFQNIGPGSAVATVLYGRVDEDGELSVEDVDDDASVGFTLKGEGVGWANHVGATRVIGDVNGDGYDDAAFGFPDDRDETGLVVVVFGGADIPEDVFFDDLVAGDGGYVLWGSETGEQLGWSVEGGDIDGDGLTDVIAGAPSATGLLGQARAGRVVVEYGRDFSALIDHYGGPFDDTLTGDETGESLVGGRGDDHLIGGGGADVLYGGAGDDILEIGDGDFRRINGGAGDDRLVLGSDVEALELSALGGLVTDVERIVLDGQSVPLSAVNVVGISGTSNRLILDGVGEVATVAGEAWRAAGRVTLGGVDYLTLALGYAELWVAPTLTTLFPPTIDDSPHAFEENPDLDEVVYTIPGTDPDGADAAVLWTLLSDSSGALTLDEDTGDLLADNPTRLNFETSPPIVIEVEATDASGLTTRATIELTLLDVNEPPAFVPESVTWEVEEGGEPELGRLTATDEDREDQLTYELVTDPSGLLEVSDEDGTVSLREGRVLDYEDATEHVLTVSATDRDGLSAAVTLTIEVLDRDVIERETTLVFQMRDWSVWENVSSDNFDGHDPHSDLDLLPQGGCMQFDGEVGHAESWTIPTGSIPDVGDIDFKDFNVFQMDAALGGESCLILNTNYDAGTWNANVPVEVNLSFPDEVTAGDTIEIVTSGGPVADGAAVWGGTPGFGVLLGMSFDEFELLLQVCDPKGNCDGVDTGPVTGEFLTRWGMPSTEWAAEVDDADGWSAVIPEPIYTDSKGYDINWDSYGIQLARIMGLPTNIGSVEFDSESGTTMVFDYVMWEHRMGVYTENLWTFGLEVDRVVGTLVLEDGTEVEFVLGETLELDIPDDADIDEDGKISMFITWDLESRFEVIRDYIDKFGHMWTILSGWATVFLPDGREAGSRGFGPMFERLCGLATVEGFGVPNPTGCLEIDMVERYEYVPEGWHVRPIIGAVDLSE